MEKKNFRGSPRPSDRQDRDKPRQSRANVSGKRFEDEGDTSERIAKRLARAGIASRREAETIIAAGRVRVNGKILTSPAFNVTKTDEITIDGTPLKPVERTRLWLYHKPAGLVTTTRDPEGRPTVFENLPSNMPRVISVGRLDINTEGLLLLTNDGGLARMLELPTTGWLRRYRVRAHGQVTQAQLDELKHGIAVDGIFYGAVEAHLEREQGSNVWLNIGLREGKNREVKNILASLGLSVTRLIRVSFGPFQLADLEEGAVRELKGKVLRDQLGERLIAESGADFDAPLHHDFPNKAVKVEIDQPERDREERPYQREWISSTGRPRNDAKKDDGSKKNNLQRPRNVNVWMAPGARPLRNQKAEDGSSGGEGSGEKRFSRSRTRDAGERSSSRDRQDRPQQSDKPWGRDDRPDRRGDRPFRDRSTSSDKPRGRDERPQGRSERPEGRSERSQGDRPFRQDKPGGYRGNDAPRGRSGSSDRPFRDRPASSDRPRGRDERPQGRSERPEGRSDRPQGDRPFRQDKPGGYRGNDAPRGRSGSSDRPFRDRSTSNDGPRGRDERPQGRSERPEGRSERSQGDRPFRQDKPGGYRGNDAPRGRSGSSDRPFRDRSTSNDRPRGRDERPQGRSERPEGRSDRSGASRPNNRGPNGGGRNADRRR